MFLCVGKPRHRFDFVAVQVADKAAVIFFAGVLDKMEAKKRCKPYVVRL